MLIDHQREKLLNAAVYFARNTDKCGITKLFKLLYFLDFEHYKQTGRSVTGLVYNAWKMGPVPEELYEEIPAPEPDFAQKLSLQPIPTRYDNPLIQIVASVDFDPSNFSRREVKLLEDLAAEFKTSTADEMIEATHVPTLPWHRVYVVEKQRRGRIPYEYGVPDEDKELISDLDRERREFVEAYNDARDCSVRSTLPVS
jgi:uncharacterized phage-associated protein